MAKRIPRQALSAPLLDALEEDLQELRVAYERYFLGIDRRPPERTRTQLERRVRQMGIGAMGSTALRFRLDGLRGRFVTYSQHWKRVCRQIEEGTYVRVIAEADRRRRLAAFQARVDREQARAQEQADARAEHEVTRTSQGQAPAASSSRDGALSPPISERSSRRPPAVAGGHAVSNGRTLYENYINARRAAGQSTEGLSYAAMMKQLERQTDKIRAQHGGRVRFEVATKDGRVKLMAKVDKG